MKTNDTIGWAVVAEDVEDHFTFIELAASRSEARAMAKSENTYHNTKDFRIAKVVLAK